MKRKVEVTLLGQRFTVRSEKDEAYVHGLASFVTRKFDELKRQARTTSRDQLAMLVALNLADELFQQVERSAATRDEVRRHSEALMQKLAAALALVADDVEEVADADEPALVAAPLVAAPSPRAHVDAEVHDVVLARADRRA